MLSCDVVFTASSHCDSEKRKKGTRDNRALLVYQRVLSRFSISLSLSACANLSSTHFSALFAPNSIFHAVADACNLFSSHYLSNSRPTPLPYRLLLREHHFVGDSRGTYVRGVRELLSHFQSESPLTSSSLELESVAPSTKAGILRSRISSAGGDGLYAENAIVLAIPQLGKFAPTVNKINDVRNNVFPTPSQVEVKHSVQITIKLSCPERDKLFFPDIRLDCGCILMSVSADQLASVIDEFPQLMPRLEYEKVTGGEAYIPKYESEDPLIRELLLKEEQARIDRARRLWVRIWRQKRTDLGLCLPVHEDEENDENADDGSSDDDDDDESDPDTVDLEYQFGPLIPPLPESPVPSYPSSIASRRGSLRLLSPDSDHDVTQSCAPADDVTDGSLMPSPVPDSSQLPPPSLDLLSADTESSTSVPHPLQMPPSQRPASASKQQLKLPLLFPFSSPFLRKGKTPVYSVLSADSDVENGLSDAGSGVGDEGVGSGDASGSFGVGGLRSPTTLSAARIVTSNAMFDDATRHLIAEDLSEAVNSPITKSRSAVFAMTAAANVAAFGAPIVSDVEAVSDAAVLESLRHAVDQIDGELARFPAEPILWPPVPDSVPESVTGSDSNHDADLLPAAFAADEVPGQSEQDMASVALFDPLGAANSAPVEILVRRS